LIDLVIYTIKKSKIFLHEMDTVKALPMPDLTMAEKDPEIYKLIQ
jgi:hypothetical protein